HDSDQIGPWSLWQGNLDAKLMIIGQDWGDQRYFLNNAGRESRRNPTNECLRTLLAGIGIEIGSPSDEPCGGSGSLFFTNAILCLKVGSMQAKVDPTWFVNCASRFLKPTVEIVRPRVLVTLGEHAYRAVAHAYGLRPLRSKAAVEHQGGFPLFGQVSLYPVYRCGKRILNTHRPFDKQVAD